MGQKDSEKTKTGAVNTEKNFCPQSSRIVLYSSELALRAQEIHQELTENKPGGCPKCLRAYACAYDKLPLTEDQEHDLFLTYRGMKIRRARESVKEQINNEKARKTLEKRRGGSHNAEIGCVDDAQLDAQAEADRLEKRAAYDEDKLRWSAARVYHMVNEKCEAVAAECDTNMGEITSDLVSRELHERPSFNRLRQGHCLHCLRRCASPFEVVPLTASEEEDLFRKFCAEARRQECGPREVYFEEEAQGDLAKNQDGSYRWEDERGDESTIDEETEGLKQRLRWDRHRMLRAEKVIQVVVPRYLAAREANCSCCRVHTAQNRMGRST